MHRKWAAQLLMYLGGLSVAAGQAPDQQRCRSPDPDVSIGGCTAIISSGQEPHEGLAIAFYNRGNAYASKGQHDHAIEDYDQAIRLNPNFAEAFINRGRAYNETARYDLATGDLDQAVRLNPNYAEAFYNRGLAYVGKGQYDRAIEDFDRAIRLK